MADLEQQIAAWRSRLSALVGGNSDFVAELEVHLRDAVEDQVRRGVPAEQALAIALTRLGSPEALAREFAKQSTPWLPARLVMGLGTLAAAALAILLAQRVWSGAATPLLALHQGAVTLGYSAVFLVGGLASCYLLARPFRELQPGQARFVLRCAGWRLGHRRPGPLLGLGREGNRRTLRAGLGRADAARAEPPHREPAARHGRGPGG